MKSSLTKTLFFTLFLCISIYSQSIIINEIYNSSGNDEWVELLVVQDQLDIRNWSIRDFNSSGVAQAPLVFSNSSLWNNIRKGTIIVIARPENTFSEDLDPSDFVVTVKSGNAIYFSGNVFSIAGGSEAVQLRDNAQTHIFGVSWGSANINSLPNPKVHFTGSSTSNTSIYFNEDDVSKLTTVTNWTIGGTSSRGVGNTVNNINWILSLRARAEGSGTISLSPITASGNSNVNLIFNYRRDTQYSVNSLKIIFPNDFSWSQNIAQVGTANFTASASISGDTISFSSVNFANDSIQITISDVTTPFYTGNYKFKFLSGEGNSLGEVTPLPIMTVYGASIPIAQAKENDASGIAVKLGELVTVRGVVTVANQFGGPSYIQDNSGGMSVFGSIFSSAVQIGDEVLVSGTITQFNGLNQIELPLLHQIISSGNQVELIEVTPIQLSNDGIGGIENFEGRLVRVNGVLVTELNGSTVSNWAYQNYRLTGSSPGDTVQLRIDNNTQMIGMVAPAGRFDVIGVLSQFKSTLPFIGGYQLMPRVPEDIISAGPIIEKFPEEVDLTSSSITLEWHTINPGTSRIRYGRTTNYELGVVEPDNNLRTIHHVIVNGLSAATIYNLQAFSVVNSDTSFSSNIISSTTSTFPTTGTMNVYFNKSVNTSVSTGVAASGNVNLKNVAIQRINNAKRSIDVALYSLSGTTGAEVASALVNAKNRGVKVRVIGEYDNRTTAPWATLQNNGIPYINDLFGSNDGSGLFHNKFFVIDYRGGAADSVWLLTGSWNATDPGTNDDSQNFIEIQDVAIAGAYTVEFEEMWGSSAETPNSQNSRFGTRKLNNTPHKFVVGGRKVECYFSPSDRTTSNIGRVLGNAEKSINVAMLTLTRKDLADSIIDLKFRSGKTRVILSNNTDTGTQFAYLLGNGVDIRLKGFSTGLLHHKYAIVDAEPVGFAPYLITGSHNWSSSAENNNDENTLIIQDAQVANQYLQEFAARYYEAGGSDSIFVTGIYDELSIPEVYLLSQNYPNPFNPTTTINFSIPVRGRVELNIYNTLGQMVAVLVDEIKEAGTHRISFNASTLPSGVYFYKISAGGFNQTKKLILVK